MQLSLVFKNVLFSAVKKTQIILQTLNITCFFILQLAESQMVPCTFSRYLKANVFQLLHMLFNTHATMVHTLSESVNKEQNHKARIWIFH